MLPVTFRTALSTFAACLVLTQTFCVIPAADAANQIVVLRGPSLDGEGTPFEEPEGDDTPKGASLGDGDQGDLPDRQAPGEAEHAIVDEMILKWLPLMSWYARIRF